MDREFIAERQRGLQVYLDFITQHHILATCQLVKKNRLTAGVHVLQVDLGPDKFLSDKDLQSTMKLLPSQSVRIIFENRFLVADFFCPLS
ncbi:unnamed protein product, partial [Coregonus sp. 'balchen']